MTNPSNRCWILSPGERTWKYQKYAILEEKYDLIREREEIQTLCGLIREEPNTSNPYYSTFPYNLWRRNLDAASCDAPAEVGVSVRQFYGESPKKSYQTIRVFCWKCALEIPEYYHWFIRGLRDLQDEGKPPVITWE